MSKDQSKPCLLESVAGLLQLKKVVINVLQPEPAEVPGLMVICPHCEQNEFHLYEVPGDGGPHLQCTNCGSVFCWGHDCLHNQPDGDVAAQMGGG